MNYRTHPKINTYIGVFIIAQATLMYEILLTRIFSVTMWYHYAFMAVSIAMFGMTVGAIIVYLLESYFTPEKIKYILAVSSFWFSVTIVLSFLTHLCIPFIIDKSLLGLYTIILIYSVLSVPFVFSGICICLVLTKFPRQVSMLYAADLAGAAFGCLALIYVLKVTDGPTAVVAIALLAGIGTIILGIDAGSHRLKWGAVIFTILYAVFVVANTVYVYRQDPKLRLMWVKGGREKEPLYQKWNSFSRIKVDGDRNVPETPHGWGLSSVYPTDRKVRQLHLNIDANAATVLTAYKGDPNELEHLKYDVTNLAHYLRPQSKVLVVGTGGGRDILSALAFDQKSVVGVEINRDIINTVNRKFGDFTGHLDQDPRVTFINDEARSYIARQTEKFDIMQTSLIDTWAATAAGAFVLTENCLYTVEAWKIFFEKLTSNGILTFSRWYQKENPEAMYRLCSLAVETLLQQGVENPGSHIMIIKSKPGVQRYYREVGTILLSKEPFSDRDLETVERITEKLDFLIMLSPHFSIDDNLTAIASGKNLDNFVANFPVNIAAPTDNNPFFFHMLRMRDIFNKNMQKKAGRLYNAKAIYILGILLITVVCLTLLCVIVPLALTSGKRTLKGAWPYLLYFSAIGLGFMLIEISQMQRLIIFLGHPTYGLSVVLFAVLLSSGLGSLTTQKVGGSGIWDSILLRLLILIGVIVLFGILTPYVTAEFRSAITLIRILLATLILFPLGFFMGMAFPIGMKLASNRSASLTPWLWGINGATSVCASVLAVVIALFAGISTSFWTGWGCYLIAFFMFIWISRKKA